MFPFWSPDGRSLGFFANGNLNRIDAAGGPAIAIAEAPGGRGGAWSSDGTILYAPGTTTPLYRVTVSGGTPQAVTKISTARLDVITSAEIAGQSARFVIGKVTPLFQANPVSSTGWTYDVSSDGKKFVVDTEASEKTAEPLTLVSNWPALLKKE
jgi:hypothetical protein